MSNISIKDRFGLLYNIHFHLTVRFDRELATKFNYDYYEMKTIFKRYPTKINFTKYDLILLNKIWEGYLSLTEDTIRQNILSPYYKNGFENVWGSLTILKNDL